MNCFNLLFEQECSEYHDLLFQTGEALAETGYYEKAVDIFQKLIHLPQYQIPMVYTILATCYSKLNYIDKAIDNYRIILNVCSW